MRAQSWTARLQPRHISIHESARQGNENLRTHFRSPLLQGQRKAPRHMLRSRFLRRLSSPPEPLPPPLDRREDARCNFTQLRGMGKRLNLTTWQPAIGTAPRDSSHVNLLVLGDSYADDIDMGYECWPTLVARRRNWSHLSCARGGAESTAALEQYALADTFARQHGLVIDERTVVLVHLGGNDLLHALWYGPLAFVFLFFDVVASVWFRVGSLLGMMSARRQRLPRASFFGLAARRVARNLRGLMLLLAARGHRQVIVSGLPVCSVVPTARVLVSIITGSWLWAWLLPGGGRLAASVVSTLVDEAAGLLQVDLFAQLEAVTEEMEKRPDAQHPSSRLQLTLLNEAAVLKEVSAEAGGDMWKDGHHPTARSHARMAALIDDTLKREQK